MARSRITQVAVVLLLLAAPAFAYRREYSITLNGVRKAGGEVCFYRGDSVRDPFALFFSYDRVGCLPADDVLDLPSGIFHVFARHRDGFVSGYRDFFVYDGPPLEERGYDNLETPLEKAAYADFSAVRSTVKPGQTIGVWLAPAPPSGTDTFFPLVDGEFSVMVPAGRQFVAMLIAGGRPIAISDVVALGEGERRQVTFARPKAGTTDVVAWLNFDVSQQPVINTLPTPEITLKVGEATIAPALPLDGASTHSLVIFKGVPIGPAEIRVAGRRWVQYARELVMSPESVSIESVPLALTPGAAVAVTWNLGEPSTVPIACEREKLERPRVFATLGTCVADGTTKCRTIEQRSEVFTPSGALAFEGIPPGTYRITLQGPFAKVVVVEATLAPGDDLSVPAPVRAFSFFGTVTLNGTPIAAKLLFDTGEAQSDETGRFTAVLAGDPSMNLITVATCNEERTFKYIPERRIAENAAYSIAVLGRPVHVLVQDGAGAPVAGASVRVSPVKGMDGTEVLTFYRGQPIETDARGHAEDQNAPYDRPVVVCATHPNHSETCTEPLQQASLVRPIVVRFKGTTLRGRVIGHAGDGILALVGDGGRITEQVVLAADGTFALQQKHTPQEYMVYTSHLRPLTVLPLPSELRPEAGLVVTLPNAPVRSFAVSVTDMETEAGFVGIWIDRRYVPFDVLSLHQDLRGRDTSVHRGSKLAIVDIAEMGPIEIAYVPELPTVGGFVDPFTLPEHAGVRRHRVASSEVVLPSQ